MALANKKVRTEAELELFYEELRLQMGHTAFFTSISDFSRQEQIEVSYQS